MSEYNLHCEFDVEQHKKAFIHYLEVIITDDGVVHYAIPSHQEYMIQLARMRYGWTRKELFDSVPKDMYCDVLIWLSKITGAIALWENYIQFYKINYQQHKTLSILRDAGLYVGSFPPYPMTFEEYSALRFSETDCIIW